MSHGGARRRAHDVRLDSSCRSVLDLEVLVVDRIIDARIVDGDELVVRQRPSEGRQKQAEGAEHRQRVEGAHMDVC